MSLTSYGLLFILVICLQYNFEIEYLHLKNNPIFSLLFLGTTHPWKGRNKDWIPWLLRHYKSNN